MLHRVLKEGEHLLPFCRVVILLMGPNARKKYKTFKKEEKNNRNQSQMRATHSLEQCTESIRHMLSQHTDPMQQEISIYIQAPTDMYN